jgi:glyoxylase-like metal-dependent hydrolase (beta-lactamase superfamily II)
VLSSTSWLSPQSDNYEYIIVDEQTGTTAVVDPYDPAKLQAAAQKEGVKLGDFVLTTHGHHDHAGGNSKTVDLFPGIKVYAGAQSVQAATDVVRLSSLDPSPASPIFPLGSPFFDALSSSLLPFSRRLADPSQSLTGRTRRQV